MKLQEWINHNEPKNEMLWKDAFYDQVLFIRDKIPSIFATSYEEYELIKNNIEVISTHTSKSILLPVYNIILPNKISFTIRYNFYNWKVSVISPIELECDFGNICNIEENIDGVYCEGFKNEWVFNSFLQNKKQFTIEIYDKYRLYTFLWIISNYMKERK
ncbi:MAG: hypothetical protein ACE5RH_00580 [Nitrosarchaeum sp.]